MSKKAKHFEPLKTIMWISILVFSISLFFLCVNKDSEIASVFAALSTTMLTFSLFRIAAKKKVDALYYISMVLIAFGVALIVFSSYPMLMVFLGASLCGCACSVFGYALDIQFDEVEEKKSKPLSENSKKTVQIVKVRQKRKKAADVDIRIHIK